jgi:hypothetical protein
MIWLHAHPYPPLPAQPAKRWKTEKERKLAAGTRGIIKGVGEEPNHTTARKLDLL